MKLDHISEGDFNRTCLKLLPKLMYILSDKLLWDEEENLFFLSPTGMHRWCTQNSQRQTCTVTHIKMKLWNNAQQQFDHQKKTTKEVGATTVLSPFPRFQSFLHSSGQKTVLELSMGKIFSTPRKVTTAWQNLTESQKGPQQLTYSSLEHFTQNYVQARLDETLGSLNYWKVSLPIEGGLDWIIFRIPFNSNHLWLCAIVKLSALPRHAHTLQKVSCVVDKNSMQKKFFFNNK